MDGYPDFYMSGLSKGNTFVNSGEQDYDFDYFNTKLGFDLSKVDLKSATIIQYTIKGRFMSR